MRGQGYTLRRLSTDVVPVTWSCPNWLNLPGTPSTSTGCLVGGGIRC